MSRIGRLPVSIPDAVKLHVSDGTVRVEGPKGTLTRSPRARGLRHRRGEDGAGAAPRRHPSRAQRPRSHPQARRQHGAGGVTRASRKVLEISGVGYRAEARGNVLILTLGFSHPIAYQLPQGITARSSARSW